MEDDVTPMPSTCNSEPGTTLVAKFIGKHACPLPGWRERRRRGIRTHVSQWWCENCDGPSPERIRTEIADAALRKRDAFRAFEADATTWREYIAACDAYDAALGAFDGLIPQQYPKEGE
jgi:hypothetical protein